ncbi:trihelix transcription factor GT-3a-like [Anopheles stephensi]|uniref:trihelix transcription factor GT-3a-like n=1 Tax=Anopheles stephensi TaxID=30069 RepID=UPI00165896C0|nr:trihelix transcription factor GT-3a-like [Anopheles stephensi]
MTKRNMWSYDETLEMLNVMLEQESLKAMNGRPFRKDKAFRLVCEEMIHRGYNTKDPKQIENRWKNLKKRYTDQQKDPDLAESNPFQFYDEIDMLMKGKPPPPTAPSSSPPAVTESKLYSLSISRVEPKAGVDIEEELAEAEQSIQDDCEDDMANIEEIDKETEPESKSQPAVSSSPRRSRRYRKRPPSYRRDETPKSGLPPYKLANEEEAYRNQKKLIDYQFGLYSKAQEESDRKFLNMSRQILDESNRKFQSFLNMFLSGNGAGSQSYSKH